MQEQSSSNKDSPISVLGNDGYRSVYVESVFIMDSASLQDPTKAHKNLARVDFVVTDHKNDSTVIKTTPYFALVSWSYGGVSDDPEIRWRNWNGFTITHYEVEQKNSLKGEHDE